MRTCTSAPSTSSAPCAGTPRCWVNSGQGSACANAGAAARPRQQPDDGPRRRHSIAGAPSVPGGAPAGRTLTGPCARADASSGHGLCSFLGHRAGVHEPYPAGGAAHSRWAGVKDGHDPSAAPPACTRRPCTGRLARAQECKSTPHKMQRVKWLPRVCCPESWAAGRETRGEASPAVYAGRPLRQRCRHQRQGQCAT